jgi:hypothetical protein
MITQSGFHSYCIIMKSIFIYRFRRYYRHILSLGFLKRNQHDAPTGLILASALGLQVKTLSSGVKLKFPKSEFGNRVRNAGA